MDWKEAYHNFDPKEPLEVNDPRLTKELFGEFLNRVATHISLNKDKNQKLLLSGHIGCGKSTFLNLLQESDQIKSEFFIVKYSIKDVLDYNDANYVDLLLSLTLQTFITAKEKGVKIDDKSKGKLIDLARELQGLIEIKVETVKGKKRQTGGEIKAGISLNALISWFKADLFSRFQIENETRESVREYYKPRMTDFLNKINDLLFNIRASLGKSLLVLIDDTDKIPPDQALEIFLNNGQHLAKPASNIVFMVDTSISCSSKYSVIRTNIGEEEFFPAIKIIEKDGKSSAVTKANCKMLGELVLKRISMDLIEDKALKKAIRMSGGVVRELVRIINEAIFNAKGKVREDHVDHAVIKIRNSYNLYAPQIKILRAVLGSPNWFQIAEEDIKTMEPTLRELLYLPALFQYRNGEDKWYRPYPIFIEWLKEM